MRPTIAAQSTSIDVPQSPVFPTMIAEQPREVGLVAFQRTKSWIWIVVSLAIKGRVRAGPPAPFPRCLDGDSDNVREREITG